MEVCASEAKSNSFGHINYLTLCINFITIILEISSLKSMLMSMNITLLSVYVVSQWHILYVAKILILIQPDTK